ncbi:MAG: YHS domain-containing protein [Candidatus Aureabacteria bacterium]|nr:YHS domain-containing protein [Candidatus Auribacterota bacterium]
MKTTVIVFSIALFAVLSGCSPSGGDHMKAHHDVHNHDKAIESEGLGMCPVMGQPASKNYSYTYEGKTYYFCCASCIEKFKNDPVKYINKKVIELEAFQYGFAPDPVKVKKGDLVKLVITSRDVHHGVYIKEFGVNVHVEKGEEKMAEFIADKVGEFDIICSAYCGPGHAKMKGKLIVEE